MVLHLKPLLLLFKYLYLTLHQVAQPWVEEYIPELDTWVPKAVLSEPRFRCVGVGVLRICPRCASRVCLQYSSTAIVLSVHQPQCSHYCPVMYAGLPWLP